MQEAPVFFQAEHGIPGGTEGFYIVFHKGIVEGFQLPGIGAIQQHTRVAHQGTADHDGFHLGIGF